MELRMFLCISFASVKQIAGLTFALLKEVATVAGAALEPNEKRNHF